MINTNCKACKNRTKLWLGREKTYMCKSVLVCPFTKHEKNELVHLEVKDE